MLFQNAHVNGCGMTISEVEPSLYVRIETDENDDVVEWIIINIWTDDVRYFGTERFVKEYEENVEKNCKCTMEGDSNEFVSIEIKQDLESRTVELTQAKYWEKAVERFAEFLPSGQAKERRVPLSPTDEEC